MVQQKIINVFLQFNLYLLFSSIFMLLKTFFFCDLSIIVSLLENCDVIKWSLNNQKFSDLMGTRYIGLALWFISVLSIIKSIKKSSKNWVAELNWIYLLGPNWNVPFLNLKTIKQRFIYYYLKQHSHQRYLLKLNKDISTNTLSTISKLYQTDQCRALVETKCLRRETNNYKIKLRWQMVIEGDSMIRGIVTNVKHASDLSVFIFVRSCVVLEWQWLF